MYLNCSEIIFCLCSNTRPKYRKYLQTLKVSFYFSLFQAVCLLAREERLTSSDLYQFSFAGSVDSQSLMFDEEIREYMTDPEKDHRKFWTNPKRRGFKLKLLAEKLFAIPATSATSECVLSRAGLSMSARRSRLQEHTLEMLTFLQCNLRLVLVPKPVAESVAISL